MKKLKNIFATVILCLALLPIGTAKANGQPQNEAPWRPTDGAIQIREIHINTENPEKSFLDIYFSSSVPNNYFLYVSGVMIVITLEGGYWPVAHHAISQPPDGTPNLGWWHNNRFKPATSACGESANLPFSTFCPGESFYMFVPITQPIENFSVWYMLVDGDDENQPLDDQFYIYSAYEITVSSRAAFETPITYPVFSYVQDGRPDVYRIEKREPLTEFVPSSPEHLHLWQPLTRPMGAVDPVLTFTPRSPGNNNMARHFIETEKPVQPKPEPEVAPEIKSEPETPREAPTATTRVAEAPIISFVSPAQTTATVPAPTFPELEIPLAGVAETEAQAPAPLARLFIVLFTLLLAPIFFLFLFAWRRRREEKS